MMTLEQCLRVAKIYPQTGEGYYWFRYIEDGVEEFVKIHINELDDGCPISHAKHNDYLFIAKIPDLASFKQWGWEKLKEKLGDRFRSLSSGRNDNGDYWAEYDYYDKYNQALTECTPIKEFPVSEEDAIFNLLVKAGVIE